MITAENIPEIVSILATKYGAYEKCRYYDTYNVAING